MIQDEKYSALRGFIRAARLAARRIGGNFIMPLKDQLAMEAFGISFTEAHKQGICLRCRKAPDQTNMTEAEKKEFNEQSGLCPPCWDHYFCEEEMP